MLIAEITTSQHLEYTEKGNNTITKECCLAQENGTIGCIAMILVPTNRKPTTTSSNVQRSYEYFRNGEIEKSVTEPPILILYSCCTK